MTIGVFGFIMGTDASTTAENGSVQFVYSNGSPVELSTDGQKVDIVGVRLTKQPDPATDVFITIADNNNAGESLSFYPASFYFDSENWDDVQIMRVGALPKTPAKLYTVTFDASTEDSAYKGKTFSLPVRVSDIDVDSKWSEGEAIALEIDEYQRDQTIPIEAYMTDTMYRIRLTERPSKDMFMRIGSFVSDGLDVRVDEKQTRVVTFTPDNWDVWRTISVRILGARKNYPTGNSVHTLNHMLLSDLNSLDYHDVYQLNFEAIPEKNTDPDLLLEIVKANPRNPAPIGYEHLQILLLGDELSGIVSLRLEKKPDKDVITYLTPQDDLRFLGNPSPLEVTPRVLTFSPQNWNTPQTVTVKLVDTSRLHDEAFFKRKSGQLDGAYYTILTHLLEGSVHNEIENNISVRVVKNPNTDVPVLEDTEPAIHTDVDSCPMEKGRPHAVKGTGGVWFITENCTKVPFRSSRIYYTYFDSMEEIIWITTEQFVRIAHDELGFIPAGPKYDPQGGALVKIPADPKVYLILAGKKYWITNPEIFTKLGYQWTWIEDVDKRLLDKYQTVGEITDTSHHPVGSLVKYENSPKVYQIRQNENGILAKHHISTETVFKALGYRFDRVVTISEAETYPTGNPIQQ
ncbi:MAG: hypothetical protein COV60_02435 [Candidatus Magasanikbacteria bacterium CG11_big_fil_rev_8_21_14_0_20_43_7]|uniref:Cadherin domain-containing protein n=1 Tax=Candidatus Magasanikbacteria bacterium CG11_big_fil_rev_8_21_14_0_20_43_7 TaxID=1974654 RepID=A0A2H0N2C4_9BACT|nr:MAG: hypothetical protein COV60_02435 [Candidatus Magasanikbacteria bacterium CG11_big_fil_rev_8_21_14_0_20_43_7]